MSTETRIWSAKQTAIFTWFAAIVSGVIRNLVVRARAGTGKTTTICEAIKHVPVSLSVLVCAFGKDIQEELAARLTGMPVDVRTLHSLGLRCVKRFWPDVKVSYGPDRANDLAERVCGSRAPDAIKKLVATLITKGRLCAPHAVTADNLVNVAIEFECAPDEQWERDGFGLDYVCEQAILGMKLAASAKPTITGIDGADMLFLPVRNGWLRKTYDVVVVDEAQDMNACQLEIAQGLCRNNMIIVGDDRQAIYGFAGADSGSLDRMKTELQADELPLNTTYRCGKAIVALAAGIVEDFEGGAENPEGIVRTLGQDPCDACDRTGMTADRHHCSKCAGTGQIHESLTDAAGPGDFILSRINAPLVPIAMRLLRAGKRTKIAGRDIGKGLIALLRKLKGRSVPDLLAKISAWETRELSRLNALLSKATNGRKMTIESKMEGIRDQAEMMASLINGAANVNEVEDRIEALFTDDGLGDAGLIVCSSVHKAKGKERNRVFILRKTLRTNTLEEQNIGYVAITRAKHELVWVEDAA